MNPNCSSGYIGKGDSLRNLKSLKSAVAAYSKAIEIDISTKE